MSLSLALSSALSGLHVNSRATRLVADNIANQDTPGYAVRTLDQASRTLGGAGNGVVATGIHRDSDSGLLAAYRGALTQSVGRGEIAEFWTRIETAIGLPGDDGSLSQRLDRLEVALSDAAARPDSQAYLQQVAQAAADIAHSFGKIETTLQDARATTDTAIARDVAHLNDGLAEIADLNREIQRQTLTGGSPQSLMDVRQNRIDRIAEIVPVTEIARSDGRVALMSPDGVMLVDRTAAEFVFSPTSAIGPDDRVETGALSGLELNGRPVAPTAGLLAEGRLGANFGLRDTLAPQMQGQLDTLAEDLVTRFSQAEGGALGLIAPSDGVWPPTQPGLSGRLVLNPLADPASGGDLTRLRSGLYAAQPAAVSDPAHLTRLRDAMRAPTDLSGTAPSRDAGAHAAAMLSLVGTTRLGAEQAEATAKSGLNALQDNLAARGVDSDAELARLLTLEQAYAANARVLSTIDAMMRRVLEI